MKKILTLTVLLLLAALPTTAQSPLPQPQKTVYEKGSCKAGKVLLRFENLTPQDQQTLTDAARRTGLISKQTESGTELTLKIDPSIRQAEGYRLKVDPRRIVISAARPAGLFYGLQTLAQLRDEKGRVTCCDITDAPTYPWRGLMIDVSRHFFSKNFIERQIDAMARYKLNTLHLHLTDAAGWRVEIDRYPRLMETAAWRTDASWKKWWNGERHYSSAETPGAYGGYFTKKDLREIVDYARKRFINVVPEIEMPAHSEEVLVAYPELSCTHEPYKQAAFCPGNEKTYEFLQNVLTEVMEVFPSADIHIGGDEADMTPWKSCPLCQKRMKELGMTDVKQLQGYLVRRIGKFLQQHGRRLVGWDEILDDSVPQNATVMIWRDIKSARKAMNQGAPVVLSPGAYCYLDGYQDAPPTQPEAIGGYLPLERVYSFAPPTDRLVRGVQGNLWTEYVPTEQHAEYMLWPRALAIAEVGWTGPGRKNYKEFRSRALQQTDWLTENGYHPFNLSKEQGERSEHLQTAKNLATKVGATVQYNAPSHYAEVYKASGEKGLIDGIRGGWAFGDGSWQGFIDNGLDVTIDLKKTRRIKKVSTTFMQSEGPEIFYPSEVAVYLSDDGKYFEKAGVEVLPTEHTERTAFKDIAFKVKGKARYIRLVAKHNERKGWIFTDEIIVD